MIDRVKLIDRFKVYDDRGNLSAMSEATTKTYQNLPSQADNPDNILPFGADHAHLSPI
jgi:hypothetical protein